MIKENMAEPETTLTVTSDTKYYTLLMIFLYIMPTLSYRFLPEHKNQAFTSLIYSKNTRTSIKDVPYHVLIVYGSSYCSGTLIGSRTVVTAASCFDNNKDEPIIVKVGSNSMTSRGQIISVIECKIHEYYQYLSGLDNDIALLLLQNHVVFGPNIAKILLVESEVALRLGTPVKVTGWGGMNLPVKYLNLILQSEMMVTNKIECRKQFGGLMTLSNFCVKYNLEGLLSDNGGGATYKELLVGILSYGAREQNSHVAILTNVSYFYRWIMLNTNKFLNKYCTVRGKMKPTGSAEYNET